MDGTTPIAEAVFLQSKVLNTMQININIFNLEQLDDLYHNGIWLENNNQSSTQIAGDLA